MRRVSNFRSKLLLSLICVALLVATSGLKVSQGGLGMSNDEIISSDTIWSGEVRNYDNESVIVSYQKNLTIVDSHINFTNFEDTGIIVDGGILKIVNSTIEFGDKCISGATNGTVMIYDSVIQNCLGDAIELVGDYDFHLENTVIQNSGGKGVDILGLSSASIVDVEFTNLDSRAIATEDIGTITVTGTSVSGIAADRGMRFEGSGDVHLDDITVSNVQGDAIRVDVDGNVLIENVMIDGSPDDGIQIEGAENATLVNVDMVNVQGDGFKGEAFTLMQIFDSSVTNAGDDGVDITTANKAVFEHVEISGSTGTGFEADFMTEVILKNSIVSTSGEYGLELVNTSSLAVENVIVKDNSLVGVYLDSVTSFDMQTSAVTGNVGGFDLINVSSADIHLSVIMDNGAYAINATLVGEGVTVDASNNYWGTTIVEEIVVIGNVTITPILDENLEDLPKGDDGDDGFLPINTYMILFVLIIIPTIRRYTKN